MYLHNPSTVGLHAVLRGLAHEQEQLAYGLVRTRVCVTGSHIKTAYVAVTE